MRLSVSHGEDGGELDLRGLKVVVGFLGDAAADVVGRGGSRVERITAAAAADPVEGGDLVVVVGGEVGVADGDLPQVGLRGHDACRLAGLAQGGQEDADQQGDDRDDHQEFDEREGAATGARVDVHSVIPFLKWKPGR